MGLGLEELGLRAEPARTPTGCGAAVPGEGLRVGASVAPAEGRLGKEGRASCVEDHMPASGLQGSRPAWTLGSRGLARRLDLLPSASPGRAASSLVPEVGCLPVPAFIHPLTLQHPFFPAACEGRPRPMSSTQKAHLSPPGTLPRAPGTRPLCLRRWDPLLKTLPCPSLCLPHPRLAPGKRGRLRGPLPDPQAEAAGTTMKNRLGLRAPPPLLTLSPTCSSISTQNQAFALEFSLPRGIISKSPQENRPLALQEVAQPS